MERQKNGKTSDLKDNRLERPEVAQRQEIGRTRDWKDNGREKREIAETFDLRDKRLEKQMN